MSSEYRKNGWNEDESPYIILGLYRVGITGLRFPVSSDPTGSNHKNCIQNYYEKTIEVAKQSGDINKINEINKAYRFLINPGKRAYYDLEGSNSLLPSLTCYINPFWIDKYIEDKDSHRNYYYNKISGFRGGIAKIFATIGMIPYAVAAMLLIPVIMLSSLIKCIALLLPDMLLLNYLDKINPFGFLNDGYVDIYDDGEKRFGRYLEAGTQFLKVAFVPLVAAFSAILNAPKVFKTFALIFVDVLDFKYYSLSAELKKPSTHAVLSQALPANDDVPKSDIKMIQVVAHQKSKSCLSWLGSKSSRSDNPEIKASVDSTKSSSNFGMSFRLVK